MKTLEEIIEELPENIRLPIYEAFRVFRDDIIHKELKEIKEELKQVWNAIGELAEAQKRTEQRVEELAEAQKKTEEEIKRMQEAIIKTQEEIRKTQEEIRETQMELRKLVGEHAKTREQLGGLSHAFGYVLEDRAIKSLPKILELEYGIRVSGKLKRNYLKIDGEYIEVNIYGRAVKGSDEYTLIGEAKSKVSKRVIDSFIYKCDKISRSSIKVLVCYVFTPEIEEYAKERGIILIPSYELEL